MTSLGFNQYQTLAPLFDKGSPVRLDPIQDYPGQIVDLLVTYFVTETKRYSKVLTADGDLIEMADYYDWGRTP